MGVASTKFAKQPTQAKSASQLKTQVKYVNEVINAICRSKSGETFFLVGVPSSSVKGTQFDGIIYVHKVKRNGQEWEGSPPTAEDAGKAYATLALEQFSRFYDRVLLLAPLDDSSSKASASTSSTTGTESEEDGECMICMENTVEVVLPDCNHAFCKKCLDEWTAVSKTCPMCRSITESNETLWIMAENPTAEQLFESLSELLKKLENG